MRHCPGPSRRRVLQVGSAAFGLSLTRLLSAEASAAGARSPKAKSVIVLFLSGGPSQLDMWDLKPGAPAEVRGTFKPIPTSADGVQISEHMPKMARQAHLYTVVRSMTHEENDHLKACYYVQTGFEMPKTPSPRSGMLRTDRPHAGSIITRALGSGGAVPGFCTIPEFIAPVGGPRPGQHAGFLGAAYDPYLIDSDPNEPNYNPGAVRPNDTGRLDRAARLRTLLEATEQHAGVSSDLPQVQEYRTFREKAFDLVSSPAAQSAFDISKEPDRVRDRYGRHHFGQSALVARRLVEAGTRLVQVNFIRHDYGKGGQGYDTHAALGFPAHLPYLKDELLPPTDAAYAALIEDLHDRGMLDDTIVVMMGEFGRTARFNKEGGRDHWARCYSLVIGGGGFARGHVFGASDITASEPTRDPVRPEDLLATIYQQLGVDYRAEVLDHEGRPLPTVEGTPVRGLLG